MRFAFVLLMTLIGLNGQEVWWSMRSLERPEVPLGADKVIIDRFIRAQQKRLGIVSSGAAEKRVLARRLAFDLWGMPLPPKRVDTFVQDERPQAYRELVDELLASPRYGERWARHWLDVVHFGETHGYDKDQPRNHAWPYRDYVIRALNEDKPYAQFVREQIAGDRLLPHHRDGIEATGFLAAGPWDLIGHAEVPESKIDGRVARHLDRDDMVTAVMTTFCSFTVQCAQCHDHKADPVTMKDYYSLQSIFAALDRSDREYDVDPAVMQKRANLVAQISAKQSKLTKVRANIEVAKTPELRELEKLVTGSEGKRSDRYGYHSQVSTKQDTVKWVQVDLGSSLPLGKVEIFPADEYGFSDFGFPHRFRVEVSDDQEFGATSILADQTGADFPRPGAGPIVIKGQGKRARFVRVVATKLWSRRHAGGPLSNDWIFALSEVKVTSKDEILIPKKVEALDSIQAMPRWGRANLIDGITGTGVTKIDPKVRGRYDRLLQQQAGSLLKKEKQIADEVKALEKKVSALPKLKRVYVAKVHHGNGNFMGRGHVNGKPREIRILSRGDVTSPLDVVGPAPVPGIVEGVNSFDLPANHLEGDRRVALANWVVHPENKLTWRSIVNRVWQQHFGVGLVETANDFGQIGEEPRHPKLLDWLAVEFRDGGGSLKRLHRMILLSETYRQKSSGRPENASVDGSNRFLWRQNRRRLEAEVVRDTVLSVAGKMNLKMGGPSFQDFIIEKPQHSPHYQYHKADPDDPATHRRSVYRFLVRSQPQPFMDALDCADPSLLVDKRSETTTSLQALAMLNNRFILRMAEHVAVDLKGKDDPVGELIARSLGRPVRLEERGLLEDYASSHGMAALVRLVFNMSEFSYVD
ncbi:MAG: DUF1553 domain-containing protein [Akkermansiaceae bacterium]|nr:DUF1553 domain-containing protein [Akkermansiaceae bacterium]